MALLLAAALLLLVVPALSADLGAFRFGAKNVGDATYYGKTSPPGSGHCSFQFSDGHKAPWTKRINKFVAVSTNKWANSLPCGTCLKYRGLGAGAGGNPVPTTKWQFAIVSDECPSCDGTFDLDQAVAGDGRWKIEWTPVQCLTGNSGFQYHFQGSNDWYLKMTVTNSRVPIRNVSIRINGVYKPMTRTIDNYWLFIGGGFSFPADVRLQSVLGDTVGDSVRLTGNFRSNPGSKASGYGTGRAQFPRKALPEVGQA